MADNSHEEEEGSAPQIHRRGSSAPGGPSLGTSSSKRGDLPDAHQKGEKRSNSQRVSDTSQKTVFNQIKAVLSPLRDLQVHKHAGALKRGEEVSEEGSATKRHSETGEGSSVNKSPPGDSGLNQGVDMVGLLRHKVQLINLLLKDSSGMMDESAREILSSDDRLLSCLLSLSFFSEISKLSCKRVFRLWVAEEFLPDMTQAKVCFDKLLKTQLIHPVETRTDGELSTFQVDKRVEGTIRALHEEKTFPLSSVSVLNVSSNVDKTTISEDSPLETSISFKLKHSKVLDPIDAPFQIVPDELTRYLSLRNTSIKVIPGPIEKLTHLEFLDLKHSLVTELPREAERLERICHILIYHYEKDPLIESYNLIGFKASCSIGGFKCLEKLCFVESNISLLKDLGNLTKLRRLGITKLRAKHCKLFCSSLQKLDSLESLNVHAFDEDEIIDLDDLSSFFPKFLKHLYLHARLEKLPSWISPGLNLTKIILRWSRLEKDVLATLGKLVNLEELELRRAYDGKQLEFKDGQFPKLKILLLDQLEGLISMSLEKGTMPRLESLTISRCQWLEIIPSGIEYIPTIQKLTFFEMSREFYDKIRVDYEKDGYKKFTHIPEVYFTRWKAGEWETEEVESTCGIRL